jgi:hypothetical protein
MIRAVFGLKWAKKVGALFKVVRLETAYILFTLNFVVSARWWLRNARLWRVGISVNKKRQLEIEGFESLKKNNQVFPKNILIIKSLHVLSLLTPAADSLAPARSALTGLRLRRIPMVAFPSNNSLLVERRGNRVGAIYLGSEV